jgi:internalin A
MNNKISMRKIVSEISLIEISFIVFLISCQSSLAYARGFPNTKISEDRILATAARQLNKHADEFTGDDYQKIESLSISDPFIEDINSLKKFTNLKECSIESSHITDFKPLKNLSKLKTLTIMFRHDSISFNYDSWRAFDLKLLEPLTNLQKLEINGMQINDINSLASLSNLQELMIWISQVSDYNAFANLKNLQSLTLFCIESRNIQTSMRSSNLSDRRNIQLPTDKVTQVSDLKSLENLMNLQKLIILDMQIKDVNSIANITNLRELCIRVTGVSDYRPLVNLKICKVSDLMIGRSKILNSFLILQIFDRLILTEFPSTI